MEGASPAVGSRCRGASAAAAEVKLVIPAGTGQRGSGAASKEPSFRGW